MKKNKFKFLVVMGFVVFWHMNTVASVAAANIVIDDDAEPAVPNLYLTSNYADDAACFQAAFNKAESGDTVTIREGDYYFNRSVVAKNKNLDILGTGTVNIHINTGNSDPGLNFTGSKVRDTVFIADAKTGANVIKLSDASGMAAGDLIRIYNNTLWCPKDYATHKTGETYMIKNVYGNVVTLETPLIRDYTMANGSTAMLYHSIKINIKGLRVFGAGSEAEVRGLTLYYCKNSSIQDSYFEDNGQGALFLYTCNNVDVSNNTMLRSNMDNFGYGVAVASASSNVRIHNNLIRGCRHAITATYADHYGVDRDVYVTDNELHRDAGKGPLIDAHATVLNYIVTGNTIYADGKAAFHDGSVYSVFSKNKIYNGIAVDKRGKIGGSVKIITDNYIKGTNSAIFSDGGSFKELFIRNNVLVGDSAVDGIFLSPDVSVEKLTIIGNTIRNSNRGISIAAINTTSSEIEISNNAIENVQKDGIYLKLDGNSSLNRRKILGNAIKNANRSNGEASGILLANGGYIDVIGNHISDKSDYVRYGIYEDFGSDYNAINNNNISGMLRGTVRVIGDHTVASNNGEIVVYSLTVKNGTGSGTYAQGAKIEITANTVSGKTFIKWTGDTKYIADPTSATTTVTMPNKAIKLTATYKTTIPSTSKHALTVKNGTGSGAYAPGVKVEVTANTVSGKTFDKWTGDTKYLSGTTSAAAIVTMPEKKVNIVATYKTTVPSTSKHALAVKNGTGSGAYDEGTKVTIVANPAISEKVFDKWTGDTKYISDASSASAVVTMPNKAIKLTATYKTTVPSTSKHTLTIKDGTGSGSYAEGTKVTIVANPTITGKAFDKWTGDTKYVADPASATTTVAMPQKAVTITASYKETYAQSLKATILKNDATVKKGATGVKLIEATLANTGTETLTVSGLGIMADFAASYFTNPVLYVNGKEIGKPDKTKNYEVIYKSLSISIESGKSATIMLKADVSSKMNRKARAIRLDSCTNVFTVKGATTGKKAKITMVNNKAYIYFAQ